jgi:hypothetical protein
MPENLQDRFQRRILSWHFLQKTAKILDSRTGSEQGLECYLAGFYLYPVAIPALIDNPELHFKTASRLREALQAAMKK